uniref:Uncharacterized protein n=1 Tax=Nelumbo nucifera TaxID=4432 RepID=A0A822YXK9_NELNU|nr:TPA_asm: hypothetical protein HUJ06_006891 [Nelumbo nucifera]
MELDSIECVSSSDGIDEEEIHHHQFSSKPHNNVVPSAISPATSVHELLECPVCTNSMYPPIHQACVLYSLFLSLYLSLSLSLLIWRTCGVRCWV